MVERIRLTSALLSQRTSGIEEEWAKRLDATQERFNLREGKKKRQQPKTPTPPYDKPNGYLKREVYRLVCDCIADRKVRALQRKVATNDSSPRPSAHNEENPFYWGLLAVCGINDPRVSRNNRSKFANELLYAHKHKVPADLLVGFIYQIGSSDGLRQRLVDEQTEEWAPLVS